MLEAILSSAGYRVGLYTSPHLLRYNERVRVARRDADDTALVQAFERVESARSPESLTYFEFGTLAAMDIFVREGVDVAVLEVGLGGRLDAVNVFDAHCAVVTTVDFDHMDYLGPDRESIAREKAGIFRAGVPAVCGDEEPPATLTGHAANIGAPLILIGRDYGYSASRGDWRYWSLQGKRLRVALSCAARRLSDRQCGHCTGCAGTNQGHAAGGHGFDPARTGRGRSARAISGHARQAIGDPGRRSQPACRTRTCRQPARVTPRRTPACGIRDAQGQGYRRRSAASCRPGRCVAGGLFARTARGGCPVHGAGAGIDGSERAHQLFRISGRCLSKCSQVGRTK